MESTHTNPTRTRKRNLIFSLRKTLKTTKRKKERVPLFKPPKPSQSPHCDESSKKYKNQEQSLVHLFNQNVKQEEEKVEITRNQV